MKRRYCGKPATHVKITEKRGGAGTVVEKAYACKAHAYGRTNPTGDDPS